MWNINTISKKKRNGSVKCKVSVKNVGNVAGTLTATPVEGEAEEIELGAGDTYILLKEVEKGKNLNTVYSSVEVVYDESHEWKMVVSQVVNADVLANANITYVATFDTDGGSTVADQNVPYGSKVTRPADPTKEDKVFGGWYTTAELTTAFDFDTVITDDTTIYAKWDNAPAPQLGATVRLINNSETKAFTYVATPTDISAQAETGSVAVGGSAELTKTVSEGEAVSTAYSSIVITYPDVTPINANLSTVATSSIYVDLEFSDIYVVDTIQLAGSPSYKIDDTSLITLSNLKLVQYSDDNTTYDLEGDAVISAPDTYTDLRTNGLEDVGIQLWFDSHDTGFEGKIASITTTTTSFKSEEVILSSETQDIGTLDNTFDCTVAVTLDPNGGEFSSAVASLVQDGVMNCSCPVEMTLGDYLAVFGASMSLVEPTKAGATFQGWSLDGVNIENNPEAIKVYEHTTLTAIWE